MRLKCKGFIFYELLVGMMLLLILVPFVLVMNYKITLDFKNEQYNYQMKQTFYLNLYYLENNISLSESENYLLYYDNTYLCMEWMDLHGVEKTYCEKYWL